MASALRSRKIASHTEFQGVPKEVQKGRPQEGEDGFEPEEGPGDALKSPKAKQAGKLEGRPSPGTPKESQSKPEKSFHLWETEYQEFLEDSVLEDQLLEQLSPWANSRAFLASFEQVAMACRWPRKEWVVRLLPSLSEDAEKAFVSLSTQDREDFQKVKVAILHREAAARESKRKEFRRLCYQEANGPREVHARLQELCHQWLNVERCGKEQILEMLILEQFLKVLPQEMQNWVQEHFPENCAQAIGLAEEFIKRLQGDEEEVTEAEEAASFSLQTKEIQLATGKPQTEEKREMDKGSNFSEKRPQGYKQTNVSKKGYLHWARYGEARLRARFPGRANTVLPYRWKQRGQTLECRLSQPLRRGRPLRPVETFPSPPPLPSPTPPSPSSLPKIVVKRRTSRFLQNEALQHTVKTCPECHVTFNGLASFRRHQMCHTGEKRYTCSFCGKGYCFRSELARHECRHVGRKPHECSYCGEGFDRKWWRDQHQMEHMKSSSRF
ncbi:uncharacterized protein LOC110091645 [Pogona vitticeps]